MATNICINWYIVCWAANKPVQVDSVVQLLLLLRLHSPVNQKISSYVVVCCCRFFSRRRWCCVRCTHRRNSSLRTLIATRCVLFCRIGNGFAIYLHCTHTSVERMMSVCLSCCFFYIVAISFAHTERKNKWKKVSEKKRIGNNNNAQQCLKQRFSTNIFFLLLLLLFIIFFCEHYII